MSARLRASPSPCTLPPTVRLLHTVAIPDAPWPHKCNARPLHHRDQAFYRAVLLLLILAPQHRPTQRTARCRSNKRDFQPDSMVSMCSMCAWATLCQRRAAEYRRNTCNSIDAPSAHGPPPLKFPCRNGKKKKKSEMQVSLLETDSDPAADDLLIHVLNRLSCPLDQKLRAFKMHTKVGARS